jgi:predicted alpha/beta-hydrolase family hydrolase
MNRASPEMSDTQRAGGGATASWTFETSGRTTTALEYGAAREPSGPRAGGAIALVLAHGAGAGHDHPAFVSLATACAANGAHVVTFNFPYAEARRGRPDSPAVLQQTWRDAIASVRARIGRATALFIGGRSMGGRIATEVAAEEAGGLRLAGLVCFGYPLRPPNRTSPRSLAHLGRAQMPVLIVQGTRDPFGGPDEVRLAASGIPLVDMLAVDGGDHGLAVPRRSGRTTADVVAAVAADVVGWMRNVAVTPRGHE